MTESMRENSLQLAKLESENKSLQEEVKQLRAYKIKYGASCEQIQNDCDVKIKIMETEQQIELQKMRDQVDKLSSDNKNMSESNLSLQSLVSGLRKELADVTAEKKNI